MSIKDLSPNKLYLVALSGGADSVALALMMNEQKLNIHALHCNFHLRGEESNRDEKFVHQFCKEHGIPLSVRHFDTLSSAQEHKVSVEMEARELRYSWFAEQARAMNAEAICVAHHKDDQAETILLNLIRGTGLKGLAAMTSERTINGLRIIRPLLDITKADILKYLAKHKQDFVTDSTNLERNAFRNRIRLDLLPLMRELNPNIVNCLVRTAENVRMELDSASNEGAYHKWLAPLGFNRQQILDIYSHRPQNKGNNTKDSGLQWCSATHVLLMDRGNWVLEEKGKHSASTMPELYITKLAPDIKPGIQDFQNKAQAFIDAGCIEGTIELRPVRKGDRFQPFGMKRGTKLVSDYLTDRKIDLLSKQRQFVAIDTANGNIVWLVGWEIDHRYCIKANTTRILQLHTKRKSDF